MPPVSKLREVTERLYVQMRGRPLAEWVAEQRDEGRSWRNIERDLRDDTGIELSNVTLMEWYGDRAIA